MEIRIEVKTKSARNQVKQLNDHIIVHTKEAAKNNAANLSVVETLAKYWQIEKDQIKIIKGKKSNKKIIEVKNENILT